MTQLEFDRDAVGVSAKADWKDSDEFSRIGSFISTITTYSVSRPLPQGDNSGTSALSGALGTYREVVRWVTMEFSDACAVLGSGQEAAIRNFDNTEYQSTEGFRAMADRLGG